MLTAALRWLPAAAGVLVLVAPSASSQTRSFLAQVNGAYTDVREDRRSDRVLLPRLVAMDPAPSAVANPEDAARATESSPGWNAEATWAASAKQAAALEALAAVTGETNWRRSFAFGQPYGTLDVDVALVDAGAYTDLGTPETLALARFGHLGALDRLRALVHVEATRRQAEGDPAGALATLGDLVFLGRQLGDRAFADEARWGLETMAEALERMRAVAYEDYEGDRVLGEDAIRAAIERLEPERGYLDLGRLAFPSGDRVSAEQIASRVFGADGSTDAGQFATTLARLDAGDRPLRLFGQAAAWEGNARAHAQRKDTETELRRVYDDWSQRWALDPFHTRMGSAAYFDDLDAQRFAVIAEALGDLSDLFELRERVRLEIVGTRTCLALVGHVYRFRSPPPLVSSVRGRWLEKLGADPLNSRGGATGGPPLEYFVPERDAPDGQGSHTIEVNADGQTLSVTVEGQGFVVYSIGQDGQKDWSRKATRWDEDASGGVDLLVWPPILGLERDASRE